MKLLSLIMTIFFIIVTVAYAIKLGVNDIGFVLSVALGVAGAALAFLKRGVATQLAGEGLLGLALFLVLIRLFGIQLVA